MKTFLAWVGFAYIFLTTYAMLGVIDYHACIAGAGKCPPTCTAKDRS